MTDLASFQRDVRGWLEENCPPAMRTPMLIVQGAHDAQVTPDRAQALYADLGSERKVYLDLGCASHNAMWERVHDLMFAASAEWIASGTVDGRSSGVIRKGY